MIVWNKALWRPGVAFLYTETELEETQTFLDEALNEPTMREAYEQALLPTLEYSTPAGNGLSGVENAALAIYYRRRGVIEPIQRLAKLGWVASDLGTTFLINRTLYKHPNSKLTILNCEQVALVISRPMS